MKQLGEQTAGAFAEAQEVLGDETPQSLLKGKCFTKGEHDNGYTPNTQRDHHSLSPSSLMVCRLSSFSSMKIICSALVSC